MPASVEPLWKALRPARAKWLEDARLQCHYAAQFATAVGISYLVPRPDDSHTNLGWDPKCGTLRSSEARALSHGVRVGVRLRDMTLLVLVNGAVGQRVELDGSSIGQVEAVLRSALSATGLDGRRLTLRRHYELPMHRIAGGHAFDAGKLDDFAELATWYGNAAMILGEVRSRLDSSEVRCWPHHFDIATLATIAPGRTVGIGMSPGDASYAEPYFYVNAHPAPPATSLPKLAGGGFWNESGWFGAVLPGSALDHDPARQETQVRAYLDSAIVACSRLLS